MRPLLQGKLALKKRCRTYRGNLFACGIHPRLPAVIQKVLLRRVVLLANSRPHNPESGPAEGTAGKIVDRGDSSRYLEFRDLLV
jgi:hypothetical protein